MIILLMLSILAYLLGSVSSAIIVCKLFNLPDPRLTGSKNPGATNVLRIGGKSKAAIVLLGDVLKGVIPVLIAKLLLLSPFLVGLVGLFAVIGHIFPVFYQFKGGKGVATALGVYVAFSPLLGLLCVISWYIIFKLYRYSSLSSLVTVALTPIYTAFLFPGTLAWLPMLLIGLLVVFQHHANIGRLCRGIEPKFEKKF
jgi:glycerol-3-phosphate acyltransferase PlsY